MPIYLFLLILVECLCSNSIVLITGCNKSLGFKTSVHIRRALSASVLKSDGEVHLSVLFIPTRAQEFALVMLINY